MSVRGFLTALAALALLTVIGVLAVALKVEQSDSKVVAIPEQAVDTSDLMRDPRFDETTTYDLVMMVCKGYSNGAAHEVNQPGFIWLIRCRLLEFDPNVGINGPSA